MKAKTKTLIDEHLRHARKKHPCFVEGIMHIPAIAMEELGEMTKNINDSYYGNIEIIRQKLVKCAKEEALDLIAVLIRFIEDD
ncbi:MAG: hypothetical protein MJ244_06540 [Clostridia bacterium]|nr:hypothetical protein [Clostridia bacterium]